MLFRSGPGRPISPFVIPFLLYCWPYSSTYQDSVTVARALYQLLAPGDHQFRDRITKMMKKQLESCHADYPQHLAIAISRSLRDERTTGEPGYWLSFVSSTVLISADATFSNSHIVLPEGEGLIPSIISYCQRQICCGDEGVGPESAMGSVSWMVQSI